MKESGTLDAADLAALERKYDSSLSTRETSSFVRQAVYFISILFALYHFRVWHTRRPCSYGDTSIRYLFADFYQFSNDKK